MNMSEETKKASLKGNNDARKDMIKAILNPEQLKKFEEMEANRDARYQKKVQKVDFKKLEQKPVEATPAEK